MKNPGNQWSPTFYILESFESIHLTPSPSVQESITVLIMQYHSIYLMYVLYVSSFKVEAVTIIKTILPPELITLSQVQQVS